MREGEVDRVVGRLGVDPRLHALGVVVRREGRQRHLGDRGALVGALDGEPAVGELEVVDARLEQVRRQRLGLLDDLVGGQHQRLAADHQGPRAVGVQALVRDLGVAVQDLDVLEGHAEPVGDDLAERRLVALAVRARPVMTSTLPVGSIRIVGVLPATGAVVELAEHPTGRQAAHLGERRDADARAGPGRCPPGAAAARPGARRSRTSPWPWPWPPRSCRSRRSCPRPW